MEELVGSAPLQQICVRLWDGSYWPQHAPNGFAATLVLHRPEALREMLLEGTELALGEAYLRNEFEVEGDMVAAFELGERLRVQTEGWTRKLKFAHLLRQLPARPAVAEPGARRWTLFPQGQHSLQRDREAIQFHYDVSNEFFALWLDARRVYSCASFQNETDDLDSAQNHKLETICRKLNLKPGQRLLDIGCGWGGLILYAAARYGVQATGITLSERQAEYVRGRIAELHLGDSVKVRVQDYRTLEEPEPFDAVVSVGMVEHVGRTHLPRYFEIISRHLKPGGLFLNHGIGTGVVPTPVRGTTFIDRYVFPDADLFSISEMVRPAEESGFELRDVENLRKHYELTLRHWVRRLEARQDEALRHVDERVYRTWRLYMAGSAQRFKSGQLAVYQTLLAKLEADGTAHLPLTRAGWYAGTTCR